MTKWIIERRYYHKHRHLSLIELTVGLHKYKARPAALWHAIHTDLDFCQMKCAEILKQREEGDVFSCSYPLQ